MFGAPYTVKCHEKRIIHVHGFDREELLVAWLSELLYAYEAQRRLYSKFDITRLTENEFEATVQGEVFDAARHPIRREIKAITYHQLRVWNDEKSWKATVIFDI